MTPLTLRTEQLHIFTIQWERSPKIDTMKPNLLKTEITPAMQRLFLRLKAITQAERGQRAEALGTQVHFLNDDAKEAGELDALGCPPEVVSAALVAGDAGDPPALNELVEKGYVVGFLGDVVRVWHEMSLRDAGFPSKREAVANSAPAEGRESAIANALGADEAIDFSESADGWFKIAPYGTFRGRQPGRPQLVTLDGARRMEAEFNSVMGKLGRAFRGVPIYHGHPDVDPEIWPDDRRIGKVTRLDARADSLWGFAEWNSAGIENKKEGWWIYPSPRWDAPPGQSTFSPDRLISIGLTNTPRIAESEPVHNSHIDTNKIMDPKIIREKLGLPPEATDEEVNAKLDSVLAAATGAGVTDTALETANTALAAEKTEKEGLANSITSLKGERDKLQAEANASALDLATTTGRITAADRPAWEARLNGANRETEFNALTALAPKLNKDGLDLGGRRDERKQGDNLREEVANAVAKLQKNDGLSYDEAWRKTKRNPNFKSYFDRSEG